MKKIVKSLILFLVLALNIQSAFSYVLTKTELDKMILSKITPEIKNDFAKYSNDIEIKLGNYPFNAIQTNENIAPIVEIVSQNQNLQSNIYKRVKIKNQKGEIIKVFPLNIQVKVFKNVLIASEQIQFNQEISELNTKIEKVDISKNLQNYIENLPQGAVSIKNFQKGNIISLNGIKEKSVVDKNSTVDIVFVSKKGMKITLQGKALKEGRIGETISVRSEKYNKIYQATVSSANQVIVRI